MLHEDPPGRGQRLAFSGKREDPGSAGKQASRLLGGLQAWLTGPQLEACGAQAPGKEAVEGMGGKARLHLRGARQRRPGIITPNCVSLPCF